jgi:membrane protein implicated in regulation of membrane protease activity
VTDTLTDYAWIVWLGLVLVLIVVEMLRLDFRALLIGAACVAALLSGLLGTTWWIQVLVAAAAAAFLLRLARPALLRALPVEDPAPAAHDDDPAA